MVQKHIIPNQTTIEAKKWNGTLQQQQQQGLVTTSERMNRYFKILAHDSTRVVLLSPRQGK
jgi:hypothetical protein